MRGNSLVIGEPAPERRRAVGVPSAIGADTHVPSRRIPRLELGYWRCQLDGSDPEAFLILLQFLGADDIPPARPLCCEMFRKTFSRATLQLKSQFKISILD